MRSRLNDGQHLFCIAVDLHSPNHLPINYNANNDVYSGHASVSSVLRRGILTARNTNLSPQLRPINILGHLRDG